MEKGFEKGKGYSTTSVTTRYREIGGNVDLSDRLLLKKIQEHFGDNIEFVKSIRLNEPRMIMKRFWNMAEQYDTHTILARCIELRLEY